MGSDPTCRGVCHTLVRDTFDSLCGSICEQLVAVVRVTRIGESAAGEAARWAGSRDA